jgi:hypothetical protein
MIKWRGQVILRSTTVQVYGLAIFQTPPSLHSLKAAGVSRRQVNSRLTSSQHRTFVAHRAPIQQSFYISPCTGH